MTGTLFTLLLLWLAADPRTPAPASDGPDLSIDACVAVDEETVRRVMEIEISMAHPLPASVHVRCVDGAQEIRIGRPGARTPEDVRTVHIAPASDDDTPAEREARSRELALSIAEFVRWPGPASPPVPEVPAPLPPRPAAVAELGQASMPVPESPLGRWQVGILCAFDHFSRGQSLMGADISVAARLGRWYLAELRIGGRFGSDELGEWPQLTTRAAVVTAATGVNLWSKGHVVGGGLVFRAQGYLARFRGEGAKDGAKEGSFATGNLGALALAAEPRLMVAVTPRFSLQASAAAGWVPRGIVIRIQGIEAQSISGVALSANLAGALSF